MAVRRATNVTLPVTLLTEAKALDVSISKACESGLKQAVAEARRARWLEENKAAIEADRAWVEQNGLPLAAHRQF